MMTLNEAFQLVYELADQNKLSPVEANTEELVTEAARQQEAINVFHDFMAIRRSWASWGC